MNIWVKNLIKNYGSKNVLDIESLKIEKGNIYGIIGANGAGKSTLLRILSGIERATSGSVLVEGEDLCRNFMRDITYSNQKPYMFRGSVYTNLSMPLKFRKFKKDQIEKKVSDILMSMDIEHLRDYKGVNLSGGETQKVALARALILEPKFLLLDEPTANIDPEYVETIESIVKDKKKDMTVIIITHNISQARRLCDEIIYMENGQIIEINSTEKFFSEEVHGKKKKFLDTHINYV